MDGVKISVNKEGEVKKPIKKRGRPKKITKKAPAKPSMAGARVKSKINKKIVEKKDKAGKRSNFALTLIVAVITGAVVGSSIYVWQSRSGEKNINDVRQDARKVRMDFEQRLNQLKNKLTGVETENQKLKDTTKDLEERAKLLEGAKKDFFDPEIGITFEYPAIFGEVNLEMIEGVSGKKVKGTFSKNDKLVFGAVGMDYKPKSSSTKIDFIESQGYYKKRDKFYFQPIGTTKSTDYEIVPSKEIETENGLALLVDKKSFVIDEEADGASVDIGENIGAIVNFKTGDFKGISFLNQDLGLMPLENFENMLASIKISE